MLLRLLLVSALLLSTALAQRAKSAEAGGKKPPAVAPQRGNRAFAGFNPSADDFASSATEKPAAGCALLIPGSGKPNQAGVRQSICITYEDVNSAFLEAKDRFGLPPVEGKFHGKEIAELGTVIYETARTLANRFGLSKDAIANGLPLIDTTKTVIRDFCPPYLMTPKCSIDRYRSVTGICNNLEHPDWGSAFVTHQRFLSPDYADGIEAPRLSSTGKTLPTPRLTSSNCHHDEGWHDHAITIMLVAWGQFIDHDMTLTAETKDKNGKTPKCCEEGIGLAASKQCLPIDIPTGDNFYSLHKRKCMNFVRNLPGLRSNCRLGPREQFNEVSSIIDAGTVYGNTQERFEALRLFKGGQLKTLPAFAEFNMKDLLPLKIEKPDEGCIRPQEDIFCFLAGDGRVNEQTVLGTIHLLMVREHNRIAVELSKINPHWNDETIFHEGRAIMAAINQHITYNEFLPMVLGKDVMLKNDLILLKEGYYKGYDKTVNPSSSNVFVSAAFRFGHTLLPSNIERWSKTHKYVGSQKLSELLQQPYDLYKPGWVDAYIMGLVNQVAQAFDDAVTQEVTNLLFKEPGKTFGMDLASINMQRAREQGVPGYGRWREWCGLPAVKTWDDLVGLMSNRTIFAYRKVYETPVDIDIWSAGISEHSLPGSLVGPIFACIIGRQFHALRVGDRFWYENSGWPSTFTPEQLTELRRAKLSRIVCDNADEVESVQVYAMVLPDHNINPRVPCKSGLLPRIDLTKWKDVSFQPPAAEAVKPIAGRFQQRA